MDGAKTIANQMFNEIKRKTENGKAIILKIKEIAVNYPEAFEQFGVSLNTYVGISNDYLGYLLAVGGHIDKATKKLIDYDEQKLANGDKFFLDLHIEPLDWLVECCSFSYEEDLTNLIDEIEIPYPSKFALKKEDHLKLVGELTNLIKEWLINDLQLEFVTAKAIWSKKDESIVDGEDFAFGINVIKPNLDSTRFNTIITRRTVYPETDEDFVEDIVRIILDYLCKTDNDNKVIDYNSEGEFEIIEGNNYDALLNRIELEQLKQYLVYYCNDSIEQIVESIKGKDDLNAISPKIKAVVYTYARYVLYTRFYRKEES